ncbi:MAG: response regulator [Burkholderiales bacterium]
MTKSRARSYEIGERGVVDNADLIIFDGDRPETVREWRSACEKKNIPSLMLSTRTTSAEPGTTRLARPLVPSSLLHALDAVKIVKAAVRVANEDLNFIPPGTRPASGAVETRAPAIVKPTTAEVMIARALVIDDSPTVRKQLELALRAVKVDVDQAESGEDGLRLLSSRSYAIVFLDVVLPGWDGYQICKTIKKDPSKRHTPVVMLTSRSSPFDRIRGSLAGCDSYLTKPVDNEVFDGVLKKYLFAFGNSAASSGSKAALA